MSDLIVLPDAAAVAERAATLTLRLARESVAARGRFTFVLSGGSTPERLYRLLAESPYKEEMPWEKTFVFVGDERFVPTDDPVNNYGMALRTLLDHVPIPAENRFPVPTDLATPAEAAAAYADTLTRFFGTDEIVFDLLLLGLGDDGHTASLFPGKPALTVTDTPMTWSIPGILPPPVDRVTLTFPIINMARYVLFLVTGAKKAEKLALIRSGNAVVTDAPAVGVHPVNGTLTYLVDTAAAGQ